MHLLGRTSFIDFPAPSSATLLLSFLFSLLLLSIIRITFLVFSSISAVSTEKEKLTQRSHSAESVQPRRRWPLNIRLPSMRWSWKWESLPLSFSTPFSFSGHAIIGGVIGNGAGVSTPVPPTMTTNLQLKCAGPAFEHPLPAIYETEVPVSMAKMIMSRHTPRKPNPIRPPRRVTVQPPRRVQSMV